jgi:hypothetical protein
MSLTDDQRSGANNAVLQLRAKQAAAIAWLTAQQNSPLPTFGDVSGAILALNTEVENAIDALAGPELARVDSGDITFDRWVADANALYAQIGTYTNDVGVQGAFDALKQLPSDVQQTVANDLNAVKPYLAVGAGLGTVVLLFLAFVYVGGLRS